MFINGLGADAAPAAQAPVSGWAAVWNTLKQVGTGMVNQAVSAYGQQLTNQIVAGVPGVKPPTVTAPTPTPAPSTSLTKTLASYTAPLAIAGVALVGLLVVLMRRRRA